MTRLGSEFLPQMDDGRIMVKVKLPTGASLAETDQVLQQLEQQIGEDKQIESLYTMAGGKAVGTVTYEVANEGELNLQLFPRINASSTLNSILPNCALWLPRYQPLWGR